MVAAACSQVRRLPPLREDVRLMPGPASADGAPSWTIYDPSLHRFLRIGPLEFEILARWGMGDPERIAHSVRDGTTFPARPEDVGAVLRFAQAANLLHPAGGGSALAAQVRARRLSAGSWVLKNYLFLRIRLLNPDRLLAGALHLLGWMLNARFATALGVLALLDLFLIGQQWETYTHSFVHLFSLEGAFTVGLALSFAKCFHEFGHGLMAKRFGCRVPGMGMALLVLWPVLWTDCTDAWRLTDRRQRLAIDAAGMGAELALAVFATLAWVVLPDGSARSGAFLLSSSTWIVTLVINVNPLMRFDGYFLLSDWLDMPNLQERGFALARWRLRRLLFGLRDPMPEHVSPRRERALLLYAYACWIYRVTLFFGIALLVYHLTFKLLGLFLMAVEIGWFIARPIVAELRVWARRLHAGHASGRAWLTAAVFAAGVFALAVPWRADVTGPAVLRAASQTLLLTSEGGELVRATANGAHVGAGQVVFALASPEIAHDQDAALAEIGGLRARLAGQAFDATAARDLPVAWHELEGAMARLRKAEARAATLAVRAPFAGVLLDVPRELTPGIELPRGDRLGILVDPSRHVVEALIGEADVARLHVGAEAEFLPENNEAPVPLLVRSISPAALSVLDLPELASVHGGPVASRAQPDGRIVPLGAFYRVRLEVVGADALPVETRRGSVRIGGDRVSPLAQVWRRLAAVVMREAAL